MRKCPCGGNLRVKDCRPTGATFRRTRVCEECSAKRVTHEYTLEDIAAIKREACSELLAAIQEIVKRY